MQFIANIYLYGMRNDHNRQAIGLWRILILLWHSLFYDTYLYTANKNVKLARVKRPFCWHQLYPYHLIFRGLVKLISIPDEELFSETYVGAPLHTLSKLYDVPVGLVAPPPPHLRQCIALYAVVEGWLLLDIELFVLFFYILFCDKSDVVTIFDHLLCLLNFILLMKYLAWAFYQVLWIE